jgi:hypothetical protein
MRTHAAVAQFEATIMLIVISLSLASVVYSSLKRESSLQTEPVFVSEETQIGGNPEVERVEVNSSSSATISSLSVDAATSAAGVLAYGASGYSTVRSICGAGETTFFSVLVPEGGTLQVAANGGSWIAGARGASSTVSAGWQEVMIANATTCSVTLPGGAVVQEQWAPGSSNVSTIPAEGSLSGTAFVFYVPGGAGSHTMLITSSGGFDSVAL